MAGPWRVALLCALGRLPDANRAGAWNDHLNLQLESETEGPRRISLNARERSPNSSVSSKCGRE